MAEAIREGHGTCLEPCLAVPLVHIETPFGGLEYAQRGVRRFSCLTGFGAPMPGIGMVPTLASDTAALHHRVSATSAQPYHGTLRLPTRPTRIYTCSIIFRSTVRLPLDTPPGASAIQLALGHPDRLHALILIAAHLPGLPTPRRVIQPMMRAAFRWERMFWALKSVMPQAFNRLTGVPKGWAPTAAEEDDP